MGQCYKLAANRYSPVCHKFLLALFLCRLSSVNNIIRLRVSWVHFWQGWLRTEQPEMLECKVYWQNPRGRFFPFRVHTEFWKTRRFPRVEEDVGRGSMGSSNTLGRFFGFATRNMKSANKNVKSTVVATIVRCFGGNFVNRDMWEVISCCTWN